MEWIILKRITLDIRMVILVGLLAFVYPASAAINTIPVGGTVFIGEQGLDISAATGPGSVGIGWWASGAAIATTSPDYPMTIPDPTNFYVSPAEFRSRTGTWYLLPAKTAIFNVADPTLAVRVEDTTVGVDVTDKWVSTDDEIRFRIESNLIPIMQRAGMTSVPITLKVQDPVGGTYIALINNAGTSTSIVDIPVTTTPYYTASIWDTGQRSTYPPGRYTVWAECNVNGMKDNYEQDGKTVSQKISLQNQDHNPLITGNYPSTTQVTVRATSIPVTTQIPATQIPTTQSPATIVTTTVITPPMTESLIIPIPQTTLPTTPVATKSPGFEGLAVVLSLGCTLLLHRKT